MVKLFLTISLFLIFHKTYVNTSIVVYIFKLRYYSAYDLGLSAYDLSISMHLMVYYWPIFQFTPRIVE